MKKNHLSDNLMSVVWGRLRSVAHFERRCFVKFNETFMAQFYWDCGSNKFFQHLIQFCDIFICGLYFENLCILNVQNMSNLYFLWGTDCWLIFVLQVMSEHSCTLIRFQLYLFLHRVMHFSRVYIQYKSPMLYDFWTF